MTIRDPANALPSQLKVINLWAAAGAGKSTTAAGLFNMMKVLGLSVELVTEYAKDLTYAKDFGSLRNQLAILGEQDRRLRRLVGQVEWAITDSPLPLGIVYMTPEYRDWLTAATWCAFERYDNRNVFINRVKPYVQSGRNQTEAEATALDKTVFKLYLAAAAGGNEDTCITDGDAEAPYRIAKEFGIWEAGDEIDHG